MPAYVTRAPTYERSGLEHMLWRRNVVLFVCLLLRSVRYRHQRHQLRQRQARVLRFEIGRARLVEMSHENLPEKKQNRDALRDRMVHRRRTKENRNPAERTVTFTN